MLEPILHSWMHQLLFITVLHFRYKAFFEGCILWLLSHLKAHSLGQLHSWLWSLFILCFSWFRSLIFTDGKLTWIICWYAWLPGDNWAVVNFMWDQNSSPKHRSNCFLRTVDGETVSLCWYEFNWSDAFMYPGKLVRKSSRLLKNIVSYYWLNWSVYCTHALTWWHYFLTKPFLTFHKMLGIPER